jgi:hypothetical protein
LLSSCFGAASSRAFSEVGLGPPVFGPFSEYVESRFLIELSYIDEGFAMFPSKVEPSLVDGGLDVIDGAMGTIEPEKRLIQFKRK